MISEGFKKYVDVIEENKFGNSIFYKYQNRNYSYALLSALLDVDIIKKYISSDAYNSILEIGAGSGRLCNAFMQIDKD